MGPRWWCGHRPPSHNISKKVQLNSFLFIKYHMPKIISSKNEHAAKKNNGKRLQGEGLRVQKVGMMGDHGELMDMGMCIHACSMYT